MGNSRKKLWASVIAITVSIVILAVSAFAATNNLSGYTRFKEVFLNNFDDGDPMENVTTEMNFSVKEGDQVIFTGSILSKNDTSGNGSRSSSKRTFQYDGTEITEETWHQNSPGRSEYVSKRSNEEKYEAMVTEYTITEPTEYEYDADSGSTAAETRFVNALIDTIMGDTKNYFTSSGDEITVHLEGAQIPELAQMALAVVEESSRSENTSSSNVLDRQLHAEIATIQNLVFESLDGRAKLDGDTLVGVEAAIVVTGVDRNGVKQTLTFSGTIETSDIGSTVVDTIDLEQIKDQANIEYASDASVIVTY